MAGKKAKGIPALRGRVTRVEEASVEDKRATNEEEREELQEVKTRQDKSEVKIGKTETRVGALELIFGIVSALMIATILFVGTHSYMVLTENRELREQVYHLQLNDELQKRDIQNLRDKLDGGEG